MTTTIRVEIPIHIELPKKTGKLKKYALNFNVFRTLHIYQYGALKKAFHARVFPKVESLPELKIARITYTLFNGSNHKTDLMNWVSIADKFFQDVLVSAGKLPDDNTDYVPHIVAIYGGVDKSNPRMEVLIEPIN